MTSKRIHTFELKNQTSELDELCRHLEQFAQHAGLSSKSLFQINLALDELFTNIVQYGYADPGKHSITFVISHDDGKVTIRIEDAGIAFNPLDMVSPEPPDSIEKCPVGGLGIHMVKKLMDKFEYKRSRGKNIITLIKYTGDSIPDGQLT